jgi:tetratricopeptide (TPR) repeat protein
LQDLLRGEALFHSYQEDNLSAINRLLAAEKKGLVSKDRESANVLMGRLKLAYGLHREAALDLAKALDKNSPEPVRNRAWFELASASFRKGYPAAAEAALARITGKLPDELGGDYQLLKAQILMSLARYKDAARAFEKWRGKPAQASYVGYNLGIAYLRAGEFDKGVEALEEVSNSRAADEEHLSLRDKANLALGYAFSKSGHFDRAGTYLERVRLNGPFSNRALLAAGWAELKQGHKEKALIPWMALRDRASVDPAVQESLLAVPTVHRELSSLKSAVHYYEDAVTAYDRELNGLEAAVESFQQGEVVSRLLNQSVQPAQNSTEQQSSLSHAPGARYLGRLLAGRGFQETLRGHNDLQGMKNRLESWLDSIDGLEHTLAQRKQKDGRESRDTRRRSANSASKSKKPKSVSYKKSKKLTAADILNTRNSKGKRKVGASESDGPLLFPELELPPERQVEPLPKSEFLGLPDVEVARLPGSEVIWLPDSGEARLPNSEVVWLPDSGEMRFPTDEIERLRRSDVVQLAQEQRYLGDELASPFDTPSLVPTRQYEYEFDQLDDAIKSTQKRMQSLERALQQAPSGFDGFETRLAALRKRITDLRPQILAAIDAHTMFVKESALAQLERRKERLHRYLERARLDLAKTYDLSASE